MNTKNESTTFFNKKITRVEKPWNTRYKQQNCRQCRTGKIYEEELKESDNKEQRED